MGWSVLDSNWRGGGGELDIVVYGSGVVHFVEVKARRHDADGGLDAVTHAKRRRLTRAAQAWIARHPTPALGYRMSIANVHQNNGDWHVEWWWDAFDV